MKNLVSEVVFTEASNAIKNLMNDDYTLDEAVKAVSESMTPTHAWTYLFKTWFAQIFNGGHKQYVLNGYHSANNTLANSEIHATLVSLTKEVHSSAGNPVLNEYLSILSDFSVEVEEVSEDCDECGGTGWLDDEEESCHECGGDGVVDVEGSEVLTDDCVSKLAKLDEQFSKVYHNAPESRGDTIEEALSKSLVSWNQLGK